jgi:hypothetical protein
MDHKAELAPLPAGKLHLLLAISVSPAVAEGSGGVFGVHVTRSQEFPLLPPNARKVIFAGMTRALQENFPEEASLCRERILEPSIN